MLATYPITLNVKKVNSQKVIKAFKDEGNERELCFTLTNGDKTIFLNETDYTVSFVAKKPDGTEISNNVDRIEDGKAFYTLTTQTVAAVGDVDCQLRVVTATGQIFAPKFSIEVHDNVTNIPAEESTDEWNELVELIRLAGKGKVYISVNTPPYNTLEGVEDLKVNDIYIQTESNDVKLYKCTQISYSHGVLTHIEWELEATVYTTAKVDLLLEALSSDLQTVIVNAVGVETRNRQAADIETLNSAKAYTDEKVAPKQDALTAGLNISIDDVDNDKVISVDNKIDRATKYFSATDIEELDVSDYGTILFMTIEETATGVLTYSLDGTDYEVVSEGLLVDLADIDTLYLSYEKIAGSGGCRVSYNLYTFYNLIRLEDVTTLLQPVKTKVQTKQDKLTAQRAINISYDNKISSTGTMCHFGTVNPETSNLTQQDFPNMRTGDLYYYYGNGKPYLIYSGSYGTFMAKPFEFNNYKSDTDPITTCYTTDRIYYLLQVGTVWHNTTSGDAWICTNIETEQSSATYTWLPLEATDLSNYYTKTQVDNIAAGKQDTLTAGNGIDIENDEVSVDTDVIATNESVDEKIAEIPLPRPITDTAKGSAITLTDSTDEPIKAISIMGKSTQVQTKGYQLCERLVIGETLSYKGVDVEVKANGVIHLEGTATSGGTLMNIHKDDTNPLPRGTYSLTANGVDNNCFLNVSFYTAEVKTDGTVQYNFSTEGRAYNVSIQIVEGITYDRDIQVQLESGTTVHPYETYTGGLPTPRIDYPQAITDITSEQITITNGTDTQTSELDIVLRGIPVSSGGNYTDNNNQQWVCDTIERYSNGTGKLIQRVGYIASYNGETITTQYMSTTGGLNTGSTIIYILDTPTETPLTSEELAELKLDTYYPITNINSNADVVVEYICDTKNYIDKKTSALQSAILSLGGNI